jgi:hypothetical protein
MKQLLLCAGLAVVLQSGLGPNAATAQEPIPQPTPVPVGPTPPGQPIIHNLTGPGTVNLPAPGGLNPIYVGAYGTPLGVPPQPTGRPMMDHLNHWGIGCEATHNTIGCTSCYAQLTFIFGSCRQFFGVPCQPAEPKPYPFAGKYGGCGLYYGNGPCSGFGLLGGCGLFGGCGK